MASYGPYYAPPPPTGGIPPYYAPPPPTGGIPPIVWVGVIGGGAFVLFRSGVFGFIGSAFNTAGDLVETTGRAVGDIVGSLGQGSSNIIDVLFGGLGRGVSGVVNFTDAMFSSDKRLFGGESVIKVWPLSWFF